MKKFDPIRNWGRRPGQPMTDEQRRAMFARMGGGAGGGGGSPASRWNPTAEERAEIERARNGEGANWWDVFKAAVKGFGEGALGGATIVTDDLTFGLSDVLGLTDSDQYRGNTGYGFSEGSSAVASFATHTALGIGVLDKLGKAYNGTKFASTLLGKNMDLVMGIGGMSGKAAIDAHIATNPTMNPYAEKAWSIASQISGYVGSIGLLGGTLRGVKSLGKIPSLLPNQLGGAFSLGDDIAASLRVVDGFAKGIVTAPFKGLGWLAGKTPATKAVADLVSKAAASLYKGYGAVSGFTGSTLKEILAVPKIVSNLKTAAKLMTRSSDKLARQAKIGASGAAREAAHLAEAALAKSQAAAASAAGMPSAALAALKRAAEETSKAAYQKAKTSYLVGKLGTEAVTAAAKGAAAKADALGSLSKAIYAAGMAAGVTAFEELGGGPAKGLAEKWGLGKGAKAYEAEAYAAYRKGLPYDLPADSPRGKLGTAIAIAIGTTGNPVEKLTRSNWAREQAEVGAYRAGYRLIEEEADRLGWSNDRKQAELADWAENHKPFKMSGRGIWDIAPAASAYLNWKAGDAMGKARRSDTTTRLEGSYMDGDTLTVAHTPQTLAAAEREVTRLTRVAAAEGWTPEKLSGLVRDARKPPTVRLVDVNTPEVAHGPGANTVERRLGEYHGPEAAAYAERLIPQGQTIRVVEDSNRDAGGYDQYGRMIRTVETIPRTKVGPLTIKWDRLLALPYIGKILPTKEFQTEMIRAGMADVDYRELTKFKGDNLEAHDAARAEAQRKGLGIWSPEAQKAFADFAARHSDFEPWVGTEKTVKQHKEDYYAKTHDGATRPYQPMNEWGRALGSGLMLSGNSGAFSLMPATGSGIAQGWNALLAYLGGRGYNETAASTWDRSVPAPRATMTDKQIELEILLDMARARNPGAMP